MAKARKCDRCGKYFDILPGAVNYIETDNKDIHGHFNPSFNREFDLCYDCANELVKWLNMEEDKDA